MMRTAEQIFSKWCLLPMRMLSTPRSLIYRSLKHSAPCIYRYSSATLDCELAEQSPVFPRHPSTHRCSRSLGPAQSALQAAAQPSSFAVKFAPAWSFAKIKVLCSEVGLPQVLPHYLRKIPA